jgi:hypothetical protein
VKEVFEQVHLSSERLLWHHNCKTGEAVFYNILITLLLHIISH